LFSAPRLDQLLLFDDADAGEQYVGEQYAITIRRSQNEALYTDVLDVLARPSAASPYSGSAIRSATPARIAALPATTVSTYPETSAMSSFSKASPTPTT
jgi:hypothetical protein